MCRSRHAQELSRARSVARSSNVTNSLRRPLFKHRLQLTRESTGDLKYLSLLGPLPPGCQNANTWPAPRQLRCHTAAHALISHLHPARPRGLQTPGHPSLTVWAGRLASRLAGTQRLDVGVLTGEWERGISVHQPLLIPACLLGGETSSLLTLC